MFNKDYVKNFPWEVPRLKPWRILFYKKLKRFMKCGNVLDIGCGTGLFLETLSPEFEGVGIDSSKDFINFCQNKKINVVKMDALKISFKDQSFDNVFCSFLIEHFLPREVDNLLNNIYRILKKNGRVILTTEDKLSLTSFQSNFWNDYTHIRPYNVGSISSLLKDHNFKIIKVYKRAKHIFLVQGILTRLKLYRFYDFLCFIYGKMNIPFFAAYELIIIGEK